MQHERVIRLVVDVKQRRPACAILQAVMGGDHSTLSSLLPSTSWLTSPTEDMRMIVGTREEWTQFGSELAKRFPCSPKKARRKGRSS